MSLNDSILSVRLFGYGFTADGLAAGHRYPQYNSCSCTLVERLPLPAFRMQGCPRANPTWEHLRHVPHLVSLRMGEPLWRSAQPLLTTPCRAAPQTIEHYDKNHR